MASTEASQQGFAGTANLDVILRCSKSKAGSVAPGQLQRIAQGPREVRCSSDRVDSSDFTNFGARKESLAMSTIRPTPAEVGSA
jgi:hypothetical protein